MKNKLLYKYALEFQKLEPWKYISEEDLIKIDINNIPYYCTILGYYNQCYALNIYKGYESFIGVCDINNCGPKYPQDQMIRYQDSINCYYDDISILEESDINILSELNYPQSIIYPFFRTFKPKYFPNEISHQECDDLLTIFPQLIKLLKSHLSIRNKPVLITNHIYYYNYIFDKLELIIDEIPPLSLSYSDYISKEDEICLLSAMKNDHNIELDCAYLNIPLQLDNNNYANACLNLCVNQDTGFAYHCSMLEPNMDYYDALLETIINYIKEYGIPKSIYLRDRYNHGSILILKDFIDIEIIVKENLESIDFFVEEFLNVQNTNNINEITN